MTARQTALSLLQKTEKSSAYSNIALDCALEKSKLSHKDRAFCSALFYGTLERAVTLDAIIEKLSSKPVKCLDTDILLILRMGIYQLAFMDNIPQSAAVNESVRLVKKQSARGFVNAVLRAFTRQSGLIDELPVWQRFSCPKWLFDKWVDEYGEETATGIIKSSVGAPPVFCRVNTLKTTEDELIAELAKEGAAAKKTDLKNCLSAEGLSAAKSDAYKAGLFYIQDKSAQLCAVALSAGEGDTVFDLCAAPGGKSFTVCSEINNKGKIYSFDIHKNRVRLIESGAKRLGMSCIAAAEGDASAFDEALPQADKVLCDVPCSGLGIIRRKPEIKYKNKNDFERLPEIQFKILSNGSKYVKIGGSILYSTCTLSKAENEEVAERFLKEHPNFEGESLPFCDSFQISIFPDKNTGDGFYMAKFRRVK